MAFLRLDRRKLAAVKGNKRKRCLETEAQDWIAQRQSEMRSRSCQLLGRTFATKRKAAEFAKRANEGKRSWKEVYVPGFGYMLSEENGAGFQEGTKPREARSFKPRGKASMHVDKPTLGAGEAYRVRKVHGIWRRYVQAADAGWRWVSDHADMDAALSGRNPLNEPE